MFAHRFTSPEPLEYRIAPAGLVTVTFMDGLLTVSGEDGQDHEVEIVKTGKNKFAVNGVGTGINELGQTSESFRGALKNIAVEGGAGADTFSLISLPALKGLSFDGGNGVDSLTTTDLKTKGPVGISMGGEGGSVSFAGDSTVIRGTLDIDLGTGGEATFAAAKTKLQGDVGVTGGAGGASILITAAKTTVKGNLNFQGGDGDDSFRATGQSLIVKGSVTMQGEAGANHFHFGAETNTFGKARAPGVVDLHLGVGAGEVRFTGDSAKMFGDLKINLGAGGGLAHLGSEVTEVRKGVEVTGGIGNDTVEFAGRTSIGQAATFAGGDGDDVLTATGTLLAVKGATNVEGGSGASVFDLNVSKLSLGGLTVTGGTSNDTVSIVADGNIAGDVSFALSSDGTGPSSTVLQSAAENGKDLFFRGNLAIDMTGATVDTLTIANIQVAKSFVAQTGENVSTVDIAKMTVKGDFKLQTGAGADVVNIDNISARNFDVNTQDGADELRIERNSLYAGPSHVLGIATILTGIGADQIRIGDASATGTAKVIFDGPMTLDAGDGANMRNDIAGSNSFKSDPTIVATGGTLTQTEAV